jgi:hypothetical protein
LEHLELVRIKTWGTSYTTKQDILYGGSDYIHFYDIIDTGKMDFFYSIVPA